MHDSLRRSAVAGQEERTASENVFGFTDTYMASPNLVSVKQEPTDYPHQSGMGLEMIHALPSVSVHGWQDQSIPETTACYNTAVSAPDYNTLSYYQQQYTHLTVVGAPSLQYPPLTTNAQSQSLYYTSGYNASQASSPDFGRNSSRRWPMTPQSHISTPEIIGEQDPYQSSPIENPWPSPILLNEHPQGRKRTDYEIQHLDLETANLGPLKRSPSQDTESTGSESSQGRSYYGSASPGASAKEARMSDEITSTTRGKLDTEPDAELRCQICGKVFTRRSNCREHTKRHNPSNRQMYPCHSCGKTFGRKTDLRRHYSTRIHDGAKRYQCELCGRHYGRLDTMYRHQKDGCPERRHKYKTRKQAHPVLAVQYSQYYHSE